MIYITGFLVIGEIVMKCRQVVAEFWFKLFSSTIPVPCRFITVIYIYIYIVLYWELSQKQRIAGKSWLECICSAWRWPGFCLSWVWLALLQIQSHNNSVHHTRTRSLCTVFITYPTGSEPIFVISWCWTGGRKYQDYLSIEDRSVII